MIYLVFAINLLLTSLVELSLIYFVFRKWKLVYYCLLCNMLTNPVLNLILVLVGNVWGIKYYPFYLIGLEIAVVLIEAFIYKMLGGFPVWKALRTSLFLNVVSFLFGVGFYFVILGNQS